MIVAKEDGTIFVATDDNLAHNRPLWQSVKAKYFFIDFYHLQSGDFKISNEISI